MKSKSNLLIVAVISLACIVTGCQPAKPLAISQTVDPAATEEAVKAVLNAQAECWSNGDLACYMDGYWKSDSLLFIGKSGLTYGWQQTFDNYKRSYPDASAMGKLAFDLKELRSLSPETMLVVGKWHLKREATKGDLQGHFSVIFKRFANGWKIVADHSS